MAALSHSIRRKLSLLKLAEELGNVSKACQIMGYHRDSFYEIRPLPYAEAGFGYPEDGQTILDVTNGKIMRLLVDDEPFDVRYGTLHSHERTLDMRAGTLTRDARWESPTGKQVRLHSTRLVSLTQRIR